MLPLDSLPPRPWRTESAIVEYVTGLCKAQDELAPAIVADLCRQGPILTPVARSPRKTWMSLLRERQLGTVSELTSGDLLVLAARYVPGLTHGERQKLDGNRGTLVRIMRRRPKENVFVQWSQRMLHVPEEGCPSDDLVLEQMCFLACSFHVYTLEHTLAHGTALTRLLQTSTDIVTAYTVVEMCHRNKSLFYRWYHDVSFFLALNRLRGVWRQVAHGCALNTISLVVGRADVFGGAQKKQLATLLPDFLLMQLASTLVSSAPPVAVQAYMQIVIRSHLYCLCVVPTAVWDHLLVRSDPTCVDFALARDAVCFAGSFQGVIPMQYQYRFLESPLFASWPVVRSGSNLLAWEPDVSVFHKLLQFCKHFLTASASSVVPRGHLRMIQKNAQAARLTVRRATTFVVTDRQFVGSAVLSECALALARSARWHTRTDWLATSNCQQDGDPKVRVRSRPARLHHK
jgi:hypothetical protein